MKPEEVLARARTGVKVRLKDGEVGLIKGCFMSAAGVLFTVQTSPGSPVCRNTPPKDIEEIVTN